MAAAMHYYFLFIGQSNMEGFDPTGGSQMLGSIPSDLPTGVRFYQSSTNGTGGAALNDGKARAGCPTDGFPLSGASPAGAHYGPELQFAKAAVAYGIPEANISILKATRNGTQIADFLTPGTTITDTGAGTSAPGVEAWRLKHVLRAGRASVGNFKVIVWLYQGEADAKTSSSNVDQANDYGNRLTTYWSQVDALVGRSVSRNIIELHPSIEGATNWVGSATAAYADTVRQYHESIGDIVINPGNIPAFTGPSGFSWAGGAIDQYSTDNLHIMGGVTGYIPLGEHMFVQSIPLL